MNLYSVRTRVLFVLLAIASFDAHACDVRDAIPQRIDRMRSGAPLTGEERELILAMHERCRRTATPRPQPPLPKLRWNEDAARAAQAWAERCEFAHSSDSRWGENLAYATDGSVARLVLLWSEEARDYSYAGNRCLRGAVCGHYTQMVARRSTSVGCGIARCEFGRYLVCDYAPPGNVRGKRPY